MKAQLHIPSKSRRAAAFTLVELLVVIGIIVLLLALSVPMLMRSFRQGGKMRVQADLQTVSLALNAYKQDFGDYPRIGVDENTGEPLWNIGAAVLGKALVGPGGLSETDASKGAIAESFQSNREYIPGEVVQSGSTVYVCVKRTTASPGSGNIPWTEFPTVDGASGPGFRTRRFPGPDGNFNTDDDVFQGKVYGPYLAPEKMKVVGVNLHDKNQSPILYFPKSPKRVDIRQNIPGGSDGAYVSEDDIRAMYIAAHNLGFFRHPGENDDDNALKRIRALMGDQSNFDGKIDTAAGETPATEADFILWTAGPDGLFGPAGPITGSGPSRQQIDRCDDIATFSK